MKKLIIIAALLSIATTVNAISRWGNIGSGFSYDALQIDGGRGIRPIPAYIEALAIYIRRDWQT